MMTRADIDKIFTRINEIRSVITDIEVQIAENSSRRDEDFYLRTINGLLHESEQTLLQANQWLGFHVLKFGVKDV